MYEISELEQSEEHGRRKALKQREEAFPDEEVNDEDFYIEGNEEPRVIKCPPKFFKNGKWEVRANTRGLKNQVGESLSNEVPRKKKRNSKRKPSAKAVTPPTRRYIVDSGASFHLVDSETLTSKELASVRKLKRPIQISTANGDIELKSKCTIYVHELGEHVEAYLHEGTVAVLSLGLWFTYLWKPNTPPILTKGKLRVVCDPMFNVPSIYPVTAGGNSKQEKSPAQVIAEEMKGAKDLIPPPPPPPVDSAGGEISRPAKRGRPRG